MKELSGDVKRFWDDYVATLKEPPTNPTIEVNVAGNDKVANELLDLFLCGKKTASSTLLKDYQFTEDPLPEIGNYWIILNKNKEPKCIVKTIGVESNRFSNVSEKIARAEGEADLSLDYWRKVHIEFFTPFLKDWKINNIEEEEVITEFYELVYK